MSPAPEQVPVPLADALADRLVGKVIDRYRVLEKIGEGGMGSVYRVEHVMLQKHMAMKLLRFELSQNQELVTRFQNEAIAASRIGQENIVTVTDFGRTPEGLVYFVMEELLGASLSVEIFQHPMFPLGRVISIAAQCCRALHAAHTAGIVHRDLKPENIILTTREEFPDFVKILDFGISKMSEMSEGSEGARLTRAGMIVGTPEYMSPEQAAGKLVDARSDIYSLGVVVFEMLSGRLPFEADNPIQMLMRHQTGEVPAFHKAVPGLKVPGKLEKVVRKALAKRPEDRQQSMAALLTELQTCAEGLEITQPALRLPSGPGPAPGRPATPQPAARLTGPAAAELDDAAMAAASRPRRLGPILVGVLVVALLAGGTIFAFSGKDSVAPASPASPPAAAAPVQPLPAPPAAIGTVPPPTVAAVAPPAPLPQPPPESLAKVPDASAKHSPPIHVRRVGRPLNAASPPRVEPSHAATTRTPEPQKDSSDADSYEKVGDLKKPY